MCTIPFRRRDQKLKLCRPFIENAFPYTYQNFSKDIFFSWHLFPARCFAFIASDKKKIHTHTHTYTYALYAHPTWTRITTNTDVFLVDTDRIVSWVRSYRMPNFRAFIALWPFDSRLSPFSTVICFERVVEEKEPRSSFIVLLSNRFEKSWHSITKIMDLFLGDTAIFFLIVKKKKRRVAVVRLLRVNRTGLRENFLEFFFEI